MRVALGEEPSSSDDLQLFTLGGRKHKNLKDLGAAFAVVVRKTSALPCFDLVTWHQSVFIASLSVGLLSYTRDIFADRPEGTLPPSSDSAITSLLFITVIFSCVAAMEFTALQLSRTGGLKPAEGHANNPPQEISAKDIGLMRGAAAASPATPTTVIFVGIDVDVEKGDNHLALKSLNKKEKRRREALKMADNMAVTSVCLLFISCLTLFAGIFTFVWANQTRSVAISVTVVFGLWCISPLRYVTIFLASLI